MTWQVLYNPTATDVLVQPEETRYVPANEFGFGDDTHQLVIDALAADTLYIVPITFDPYDTNIAQSARNAALEVINRNQSGWVAPEPHLTFQQIEEMIREGRLSRDRVPHFVYLEVGAPIPPGTPSPTIIVRPAN